MSLPQVHQLLHGYRNGHELLAGSVKLAVGDAELVARLSDLSGTLLSDVQFQPYVTVYPLPSAKYYAIARTWLDNDAPRSGCVLTRTALVAMTDWQTSEVDLFDVLKCLSLPSRDDTALVQHPLVIELNSRRPVQISVPLEEIEGFVAKYFGEGIKPIVWLRDDGATDVLVSISRVLWPQLRRRFAACTLSLQPRNLAETPFDLLFAPTAVYSRFSKVARENLIESSGLSKSRRAAEDWMLELVQLISTSKPLPVPKDWPDFDKALGPEPTSVRWLFLLNDLRARTQQSPNAALGAMDVVERLCPDPASEIQLKASVAESALSAADQIEDAQPALSYLQLVCERLSHPTYSEIIGGTLDQLQFRVEKWAHRSLDQALAGYEELLGRINVQGPPRRSFRAGLIDGIRWHGANEPSKLIALHDFDVAATDIVPCHAPVGRSYLQLPRRDDFVPSRDIARWLQSHSGNVDWVEWASMLGSLAEPTVDEELFGECFSRLSDDDVGILLNQIQSPQLGPPFANAIEKYLVPTHRLIVRQWAFALNPQSVTSARIASATFDLTFSGITELLDYEIAEWTTTLRVLVQFLVRLPHHGHLPSWVLDALGQRPAVIVDLSRAASDKLDGAIQALSRILRELDVLPPDAANFLMPIARDSTDPAILEDVASILVRTIFVGALRGTRDTSELRQIDEVPALSAWLSEADGSRFASLFAAEIAQNGNVYAHAWSVLAEAPEALYRSRRLVTIAIVNQLIRQPVVHWTVGISDSWRMVLDRAKLLCEPRSYTRHCVQALGFSFANSRLPVSSVIRSSFPDVYKAVVEQAPYSDEANSLLSFDWDRAKGLRRNLVDNFYQADWPAGDLALAAAESFGLRKLFRRVWRKWSGEDYVMRMISDLRRRDEPLASSCLNELISYHQAPHFHEPWD